jgi:hypothetical protein
MKNLFKFGIIICVVSCLFHFCSSPSTDISSTLIKTPLNEANISVKNMRLISKYKNERFIFIDYSKPSSSKRLWVIEGDSVLLNTYVSHGENSGLVYATKFSNKDNSHMSSVGEFRTLYTYDGKHGLSLKIEGLDNTNDNAFSRNIVFHSAPYASKEFLETHGYLGRSHGCFATSEEDNQLIIGLATEMSSIKVLVVS